MNTLTLAHLAYINQLGSGHAYCPGYVGRASGARLYTEMADGIAFSVMGEDGQPKHYFVPDSDQENET
jgi:hypothetical protein